MRRLHCTLAIMAALIIPLSSSCGARNDAFAQTRGARGAREVQIRLDDGNCRSFVVGNNRYLESDAFPWLNGAANDATMYREQFLAMGFKDDDVVVLSDDYGKMGSFKNIKSEWEAFLANCDEDDCIFVVLSGHGMQDNDGKSYFIPIDGESSDSSTWVSIDGLVDDLKKVRCRFKCLIVDACRSVPGRGGAANAKGMGDLSGLAQANGMVVIQGTKSGSRSFEEKLGASGEYHGLLSYYLVEAWKGNLPGAVDSEGNVTFSKSFESAKKAVEKSQNGRNQSPRMWQWDDYEDFVLTSAEVPPPEPPKPPKPPKLPESFTDANGIAFQLIHHGSFMMGNTKTVEEIDKLYPGGEVGRHKALLRHKVTLTKDFYLAKYPVTRGDFKKFVIATGYETTAEKEGSAFTLTKDGWKDTDGANWQNPGFDQTDAHPVVCVSYEDALAYIKWLNNRSTDSSELQGFQYRLPTEAEWEYACRAGTETEFFWGEDADEGDGYLNGVDLTHLKEFWGMSTDQISDSGIGKQVFNYDDGYVFTSPVGRFQPNPWGLYDMLGNVLEWCQDWYGDYPTGAVEDPTGPSRSSSRVLRGGSWADFARLARAAYRYYCDPANRNSIFGFRLAYSSTK